jgi:GT2 family glycosyltransferase
MDVSVIIPTHQRTQKLVRCVERLLRQDFAPERFEIRVGVDGGSDADVDAILRAIGANRTGTARLDVRHFSQGGPGVTRNQLVTGAAGRLLVLLNDDVLPEPDLLSRHVAAHHEWKAGRESGAGSSSWAMVVGAAPWVKPAASEDALIDRLVRETSMIFFYDQMDTLLATGKAGHDHDWGFRHAWTLNFSIEHEVFDRVGGFNASLRHPMFEDLEFAHRVQRTCGAPVLYRPEAVVAHDHRIRTDDYLRREKRLGVAAWELAGVAPACAREVFGRDVRSAEEVDYSRVFIERERSLAERLSSTFAAFDTLPADAVGRGDSGRVLIDALYQQHLLLKRWTWRQGLLEAAEATA